MIRRLLLCFFALAFSVQSFAITLIATCNDSDVGYDVAQYGGVVPVCGHLDPDTGTIVSSLDFVDATTLSGVGGGMSRDDFETLSEFVIFICVGAIATKMIMRMFDSRAGRYD